MANSVTQLGPDYFSPPSPLPLTETLSTAKLAVVLWKHSAVSCLCVPALCPSSPCSSFPMVSFRQTPSYCPKHCSDSAGRTYNIFPDSVSSPQSSNLLLMWEATSVLFIFSVMALSLCSDFSPYPSLLWDWNFLKICLFQFNCSVISNSDPMNWSMLPCPPPIPRACLNSCPSSQWCHPTIVIPFSSCLQSFPATGSFPMSQFFFGIAWPKYWSFSFSISPSNEYSGL